MSEPKDLNCNCKIFLDFCIGPVVMLKKKKVRKYFVEEKKKRKKKNIGD